jgi:hypothetical protein
MRVVFSLQSTEVGRNVHFYCGTTQNLNLHECSKLNVAEVWRPPTPVLKWILHYGILQETIEIKIFFSSVDDAV